MYNFWGTSLLFSTVAAPTYIPTNRQNHKLFQWVTKISLDKGFSGVLIICYFSNWVLVKQVHSVSENSLYFYDRNTFLYVCHISIFKKYSKRDGQWERNNFWFWSLLLPVAECGVWNDTSGTGFTLLIWRPWMCSRSQTQAGPPMPICFQPYGQPVHSSVPVPAAEVADIPNTQNQPLVTFHSLFSC